MVIFALSRNFSTRCIHNEPVYTFVYIINYGAKRNAIQHIYDSNNLLSTSAFQKLTQEDI